MLNGVLDFDVTFCEDLSFLNVPIFVLKKQTKKPQKKTHQKKTIRSLESLLLYANLQRLSWEMKSLMIFEVQAWDTSHKT